jgi:hypothetical protein
LLARLAPDPEERLDLDATERAFLDLRTDGAGMLVGRFQLDPAAGATLRAALDSRSAPEPVTDLDGRPVRDPRPARRRRADALAELAETALGVTVPRRGERPRVVIHATPAQLTGAAAGLATTVAGEPSPVWLTGRLACGAVLQRVVEDPSLGPLDVGREHRLVTLAQRRAPAARDRGCVICGAQPDWCDAHHIVPWSQGGATDLDDLALVCPGHHTAVHAGTWLLERDDDGDLVIIPPRHADSSRTPRRPVAHLIDETLSEVDRCTRDLAERSVPLRT